MPRIRDIFKTGALFAFAFLFIAGAFLHVSPADAFIGPGTQSPGSGGGSFKLDASGSIGFGTPTAAPSGTFDDNGQGFGYVFTVASSTNPGLALRNLASGNMYLWSARNMGNLHLYRESSILPGKVLMDITPTGNVGISVFGPSERLEVGGNVKATAFVGNVSGEISAGNVTSDVFGSLGLGGSYAFPASLGVATSTKTGLPQSLSVYGGGYFSGNVGIGTTAPGTYKLNVQGGEINLGGAVNISGGYAYFGNPSSGMYSNFVGNNVANKISFAVRGGSGQTANIFKVTDSNGTANYLDVTASGSVGIGTASPGAKLDVKGNGNTFATTNFKLANSDGTTIFTVQDHSVGKFTGQFQVLGGAGANQLYVETGNVYVGSGAVGIGTLTPTTAKLVVASSTNGAAIDVVGGRIINVGTPTAASDATTKSYVDSVVGGSGGVGAGTSGQTLRHNGTGWVASSLIYNNDTNVGIGTTGPAQKLDVVGSIQALNYKTNSTNTDWTQFMRNGGGAAVYINQVDTTNPILRLSSGTVSPNANVVLTVENNGSVGIGSTSPAAKLDVVGGGAFTQPVTVGTPTATGHAATKSYVDSVVGGGAGSGSFATLSVTGNSYLATTSGNVGVGTTSPGAKLQVQGDIKFIPISTGINAAYYYKLGTLAYNGARVLVTIQGQQAFNDQTYDTVTYASFASGNASGEFGGWQYTVGTATVTNPTLYYVSNGTTADIYVDLGQYFAGTIKIENGGGFTINSTITTEVANPAGVAFTKKLQIKNNLYVDGNVGIGTTNPSRTLTVNGILGLNSGATEAMYINPTTTGTDLYMINSTGGAGLRFDTRASGNSYINVGNFGIGSATPSYKLDVTGTGQFTQPVIVGTPTATNHAATKSYVDSATVGQTGWTDSAGNVYLTTPTDNVGIGTTAPVAKLDVSGSLNVSGGLSLNYANSAGNILYKRTSLILNSTFEGSNFTGWSNQTPSYLTRSNTTPGNGFSGLVLRWDASGGAQAQRDWTSGGAQTAVFVLNHTYRISFKYRSAGQFRIHDRDTLITYVPANTNRANFFSFDYTKTSDAWGLPYLLVYLGDSATCPWLEMDELSVEDITSPVYDDALYADANGNIGIGTTSPLKRLQVEDTVNDAYLRLKSTTGNVFDVGIQTNGVSRIDSSGGSLMIDSISGVNIQTIRNANTVLNTAGGNVGIGSATPSYKLDVVGTSQFSQPVIVGTPTATNHATTKSYVDSMFTGSGQWTTSGTNIYSSLAGNVGIGANAPVVKFAVGTNASAQAGVTNVIISNGLELTGTYPLLDFKVTSGSLWRFQSSQTNNDFYLQESTTPRITLQSGGNVGIGTTAPNTRLHSYNYTTDGTAPGRTSVIDVLTLETTNTGAAPYRGFGQGIEFRGRTYQNSTTRSLGRIAVVLTDDSVTNTGTALVFQNVADSATLTAPVERMRIDYNGNVGINSTTPGYKLDVVGTGQFTQPVLVGTPTAAGHAATKSYVDSSINSGVSGSTNYIPKFTGTNTIGNSVVTQQTAGTAITVGAYLSAGYSGSDYGSVGYGIAYTATSGTWNYRNADTASKLQFAGGGFQFDTAPSGTAGNPITFTRVMTITQGGSVGIGTASPSYTLDVRGGGTGYFSNPVFVGTPTNAGHAATKSYVDSILAGTLSGSFTTLSVTGTSTLSGNWQLGGASLGNVNLNGYDIVAVNKITAAVIDPLYEIDGEKYATYAPSVAGGVREEYVGRGRLTRSIKYQEESIKYEYVINLTKVEKGSDLWVWYNAVDFSKDNVEAVVTPYGSLAKIGYRIEGEKIVFFGDQSSEFSFRLFGKRHDWKEWGTKRDTGEKASFILKAK